MEISYEVEKNEEAILPYGGDPCYATCWQHCDAGSDRGCWR